MSKVRIKKRKLNIIALFLLGVVLLGATLAREYFFDENDKIEKENVELDRAPASIVEVEKPSVNPKKEDAQEEKTIPDKFLIEEVSFMTQAPFAKWDEVHEEACEEASIIMLEYFKKDKELTPEIAEKEIQELVKYQIKTNGDFKDSNVDQTAKLAKYFYGLDLEVVRNIKKEDLKNYLAQKRLIIAPAAGRELGNPFFTPPGPLYHNLVIMGYDGKYFITNDPGTKRGQNYRYEQDVLWNAIHDFPGKKEDILKGQKAVLVLK